MENNISVREQEILNHISTLCKVMSELILIEACAKTLLNELRVELRRERNNRAIDEIFGHEAPEE